MGSRAGASSPTRSNNGGRLHSANSTGSTSSGISSEGRDTRVHKAAFHGDVSEVEDLLARAELDPSAPDKHGNTALHIAVMLGHKDVIVALLKRGARVKEKNLQGWTPLDEALSYGNGETVLLLLKKLREQTTEGLIKRRRELIRSLQNLEDFYAELKWEFHSWVPFISRLLPSDIVRVYKTGSCVRLDSTLGDFSEMRWSRGDLSFIFDGESTLTSNTLSVVVLDNRTKEYQRIKLLGSEDLHMDLKDHVTMLMTRPITYANMSTQPIVVSRAQTGWFFKQDKSERIGEYETDVYNVNNLILVSRKRREHLTPEQIRQHDQLQRKVESGNLEECDFSANREGEDSCEDLEEVQSISPPPANTITWEQYISAPSDSTPHLGRKMDLKVERKHFKASLCISDNCPIEIKKLLDILEVVAPYKHFHKLRQFVDLKLPAGFPVKLDIPVFPTVTAIVTLDKYEHKSTPTNKFLIPRDYQKFIPKTGKENGDVPAVGEGDENNAGNDKDSVDNLS